MAMYLESIAVDDDEGVSPLLHPIPIMGGDGGYGRPLSTWGGNVK